MLSVFNTYENSIISYGCEIWGFHTVKDREKLHIQFCKTIIGVRKDTCNYYVYNEIGRFPMQIVS